MNKLTNKLKLQKGQSGFTIIEVLIVLAIGALIILAVLLAVPALQTNNNNNTRKAEASRIAAAAVAFIADSNNSVPSSKADATNLANRAGITTASQFKNTTPIIISSGAITKVANDQVNVVTGAKCSGASDVTTAGAITTSVAVLYPVSGTSTALAACINAN